MEQETIFVMIAAYRDPELVPTIENALAQAAHPQRLHFAVCYQDEVTFPAYRRLKSIPNLKLIVVPPYESKGCSRARALTQLLFDGEDYILQLDSHMRFVRSWDDELIRMLAECPSEKPLFSMYCNDFYEYELYLQSLEDPTVIEKGACVEGAGNMVPFRLLNFGQARFLDQASPCIGAFISGHFIFARSSFISEIPADSELYFDGEETSLSVRAWTHGWDLYTPYRNLVFHKYESYPDDAEKQPDTVRVTHWNEHNHGLFDYLSKVKVRNLTLGLVTGTYGIGSERSLADYERFSGVDFRNMTVSEKTRSGIFDD